MFITAMGSKSKKTTYFKRALALVLMGVIFITSAFSVAALSRTAVITVDGKELTVTTISTDTDDILARAGIEVTENDEIIRYDNVENHISIIVNRAFTVTVKADGKMQTLVFTSGTVQDALDKANVVLADNDVVTPQPDTELTEDMQISVSTYVPVTIKADGKTEKQLVPEGTVENALAYLDITLSEDDRLNVKKTETVQDNMTIQVSRVTYKTVTKTEKIAHETVEIATDELYKGETKVVTEGVDGKRELTVKQTIVDGKVETEKVTSKKVLKEAVTEEILVGTKVKAAVTSNAGSASGASGAGIPTSVQNGVLYDANGNEVAYSNVIYGSGTAYYAPPGALTATGAPAQLGGVAVNPNIIPYGSKLYIVAEDGFVYGYATAIDTGGALMDGSAIVDCYYPTYEECVVFGRRNVYVYVLS